MDIVLRTAKDDKQKLQHQFNCECLSSWELSGPVTSYASCIHLHTVGLFYLWMPLPWDSTLHNKMANSCNYPVLHSPFYDLSVLFIHKLSIRYNSLLCLERKSYAMVCVSKQAAVLALQDTARFYISERHPWRWFVLCEHSLRALEVFAYNSVRAKFSRSLIFAVVTNPWKCKNYIPRKLAPYGMCCALPNMWYCRYLLLCSHDELGYS